jgi:hypothetical protein
MGTFDRSARIRTAVAMWSIATFLVSTTVPTIANEIGSPQFRKGLWSFQRTIERIRESHPNQLLVQEEMTRCVDPSLAMKAIFSSPPIGSCTSTKPVLINNRYVFANRCDFMGPVRTEIIIESDESYIELNVLSVGAFPRVDTVVAQRIGNCDTTAGYQPSSTSDGFQLSSASSKKVSLSGKR